MTALRALVIDDDVDAAEWLAYTLQSRFPELRIETRLTPDVSGEYDLYFIDNDFHGESMAGDLAHSIRDLNPNGLIVAFSARLDGRTLKRLVNAGCDGAFDKSSPEEVNHLLAIVDKYMAQSKAHSQDVGSWERSGPFGDCCPNGIADWNWTPGRPRPLRPPSQLHADRQRWPAHCRLPVQSGYQFRQGMNYLSDMTRSSDFRRPSREGDCVHRIPGVQRAEFRRCRRGPGDHGVGAAARGRLHGGRNL